MFDKTIAIDFDGTIRDWHTKEPIEGSNDVISNLHSAGYDIIIHTANPDTQGIRQWLKENNFPLLEVTNKKPMATLYIDNRGEKFTTWSTIAKHFKGGLLDKPQRKTL